MITGSGMYQTIHVDRISVADGIVDGGIELDVGVKKKGNSVSNGIQRSTSDGNSPNGNSSVANTNAAGGGVSNKKKVRSNLFDVFKKKDEDSVEGDVGGMVPFSCLIPYVAPQLPVSAYTPYQLHRI